MGALLRLSALIDAVNAAVGRGARVLSLGLVLVTTTDVVMRYLFSSSFVWVQEMEWHLFAMLFLLAAGYAHLKGDHVRVDIFYAQWSPRGKAIVDVIGTCLFLIPTCFLLVTTSVPFVQASLAVNEGSPDPGGLPARYLLKAVIPVGFVLLGLQGLSELVKSVAVLRGSEPGP